MKTLVYETKQELGEAAARRAGEAIRRAIAQNGTARVVAATGASQLEFLDALCRLQGVDWSKVTFFQLDEYVGLPATHPASFRRYLRQRIVERVHPGAFHFVEGDAVDLAEECRRIGALVASQPVDIAFVGIGENAHLAFNDPPADFEAEEPYLLVDLDLACRRQQLGEGWFHRLEEVPTRAISMSVRQILKACEILAVVPDGRKAQAVRDCLELPVGPAHPASALRNHLHTTLYLDDDSASLLTHAPGAPARRS